MTKEFNTTGTCTPEFHYMVNIDKKLKEIKKLIVKFLERHGRLLFLTFLRPLINGQGFYHIETQTTDERQMDLVVDFGIDQFIIELKIRRGQQYQQEGYEQLVGYLEQKGAKKGYLLTFDFRSMRKEKKSG